MADVIWTAAAVVDFDAVHEYIVRGSRRQANLFDERVLRAVERLRDVPLSGRAVPRMRRNDVREIVVGRYRIAYVPIADG